MIRYRLKCTTEDTFVYWNLLTTDPLPTTCSRDTSHSVDTTTISKVKQISDKNLKVVEEDGFTNGKWHSKSVWLQGASGINVVTTQDFTWDHPISVLNFQIVTTTENMDDYVELSVIPDEGFGEGVIGVLGATGVSGATGISVSQTIVDNVFTMDYISLKLGETEQSLGYITTIDKENRILYYQTPLAQDFPSSVTAVKLQRFVMGQDDFSLGPPHLYNLGISKLGATYVPKNYIVRVGYKNKSENSKRLYAIIEYLE